MFVFKIQINFFGVNKKIRRGRKVMNVFDTSSCEDVQINEHYVWYNYSVRFFNAWRNYLTFQ